MSRRSLVALTFAAAVLAPASATPQSLGVFRWQLQPYCNVITVMVTATGPFYTLQGTDDQCGAAQQAAVSGTAFLNPDGTIGIGLTTISAPGGLPGYIDATVTLPSASGTWRDRSGASGSFVLTPGAAVPGDPRPVGRLTAVHTRPGNFLFNATALLPLNGSGESSISFTLHAAESKVLTFSAECAVGSSGGNPDAWISLEIVHNGRAIPPTVGANDAFCSSNETPTVDDGWRTSSITVVIPAFAGVNTISIGAALRGGATTGWIGDSSLVIR